MPMLLKYIIICFCNKLFHASLTDFSRQKQSQKVSIKIVKCNFNMKQTQVLKENYSSDGFNKFHRVTLGYFCDQQYVGSLTVLHVSKLLPS